MQYTRRENAKTTCQTGFTLSFAQTVKDWPIDQIDLPGIGLQDCAIQKEWELTLGTTKQLPLFLLSFYIENQFGAFSLNVRSQCTIFQSSKPYRNYYNSVSLVQFCMVITRIKMLLIKRYHAHVWPQISCTVMRHSECSSVEATAPWVGVICALR